MSSLSKTAAHALRHAPWLYALELDDDGWVDVASLAAALGATEAGVEQMVATSPKNRYELYDGRIRARYGHSFERRVTYEVIAPPDRLFHGTAPESVEAILRDGLLPRARQYVHLSLDAQMAREVGRRKARQPILLTIDAARAHAEGVAFYRGNERVILADTVPPRFLTATP
jgi:putative RNA 2'-phosphotransferase